MLDFSFAASGVLPVAGTPLNGMDVDYVNSGVHESVSPVCPTSLYLNCTVSYVTATSSTNFVTPDFPTPPSK